MEYFNFDINSSYNLFCIYFIPYNSEHNREPGGGGRKRKGEVSEKPNSFSCSEVIYFSLHSSFFYEFNSVSSASEALVYRGRSLENSWKWHIIATTVSTNAVV